MLLKLPQGISTFPDFVFKWFFEAMGFGSDLFLMPFCK